MFQMVGNLKLILCFSVLTLVNVHVDGHGRLMDPPSRSTLWRFPEFAQFEPPQNYDDNELYCGGFEIQHNINGGKCGVCGDPWNQTVPRDNEDGGYYGRGIITRNYTVGQMIIVDVELTSSHWGYWEIRLCPIEPPTQECFDSNVLQFAANRGTKFQVEGDGEEFILDPEKRNRAAPKYYSVALYLPKNVRCQKCTLQWYYRTGTRWGEDKDGTQCKGCGPQETFINCADIRIN